MLYLNIFFSIVFYINVLHSQNKPDNDLQSEEVAINSSTEGITLSGTFSKPQEKGKFPAVILIWGNGPHTRDQIISGTPVFKYLSDFFVSLGYAVLRIDKRGFGKSTGSSLNSESEDETTTLDLSDDIQSCYRYMLTRYDIDTGNIGLFGHSEGALIASIVASREPGIKWLVLLAPPSAKCEDIFLYQRRLNMDWLGIDKEVKDKVTEVYKKMIEFLKTDADNDSLYFAIGWEFLFVQGVPKEEITHEFIDKVISGFRTKWNELFLNIDPKDYLSKLKIPILAIFGAMDDQVSIKQNIVPLIESFREAGNKNFKIEILSNNDHYFLQHNGELLDKHIADEMTVSKDLFFSIRDWLVKK